MGCVGVRLGAMRPGGGPTGEGEGDMEGDEFWGRRGQEVRGGSRGTAPTGVKYKVRKGHIQII